MSFSTPGWTWTNTGTQSSTLNETVGQTMQSMPDLVTWAPVVFTTQTALEQTTSATELGHSATVLRTSTGSSTMGNSWGGTSTEGSYSSPGLSGISMRAHALVPVGSDGLSYAMNNNPTNYVGDYLWTANDLLGGGSSAAPEAQGFSRNFGTSLTTQKTLAATPGASTTNSDNAGSAGAYSSSGNTAYGSGSGGSSGSTAETAPEDGFRRVGLLFVKTAGMIIEAGVEALAKGLSNGMADQAGFLLCDGNSCVYHDLTTGRESSDPSALVYGGYWNVNGEIVGVWSKANDHFQEQELENPNGVFWSSLGGTLAQAWEDTWDGDAGKAMGDRVFKIHENGGGNGDSFGFGALSSGLASEMAGTNMAAEALGGADLETEEILDGGERWRRGVAGGGSMFLITAAPFAKFEGALQTKVLPGQAPRFVKQIANGLTKSRSIPGANALANKVANIVPQGIKDALKPLGMPVGQALKAAGTAIADSRVGRAMLAAGERQLGALRQYICTKTGGKGVLGFGANKSGVSGAMNVGDPALAVNAEWFATANSATPIEGVFDVAGHGDFFGFAVADGIPMSADDLAKAILANPGYTPGTPVRLLSCWNGTLDNGFAQQLANRLGANVIAANGPLTVIGGQPMVLPWKRLTNPWIQVDPPSSFGMNNFFPR